MTEPRGSDGSLVLASPISLTGRYAHLGRLAAAGLHQAVEDVAHRGGVRVGGRTLSPEVVVFDDGGTRAGVRHALDVLARADLVIGPYGSDLVVEAARWSAERARVLWNHGGSADDAQRMSGVVSVPAPASRYLVAVLEAVADRVPGARVLVAAGRGAFGSSAGRGAGEAAARLGMGVVAVVPHDEVPDEPDAEVLLAAGSFADDVALIHRLRRRPPVVATVAAGLGAFGAHVRAEGVLAPSQWEEGARFHPDAGPRPADVMRSLRARVTPPSGSDPASAASTIQPPRPMRRYSSRSAACKRRGWSRTPPSTRPPVGCAAPRSLAASGSGSTGVRPTTPCSSFSGAGTASGWSGPRPWPKSRSQCDGSCAGYSLEGEQKWGRK